MVALFIHLSEVTLYATSPSFCHQQKMENCEKKNDMMEDLSKQIEVFTYLFDSKHHEHLLSKGKH